MRREKYGKVHITILDRNLLDGTELLAGVTENLRDEDEHCQDHPKAGNVDSQVGFVLRFVIKISGKYSVGTKSPV